MSDAKSHARTAISRFAELRNSPADPATLKLAEGLQDLRSSKAIFEPISQPVGYLRANQSVGWHTNERFAAMNTTPHPDVYGTVPWPTGAVEVRD
jgi:hypothetical protein